MAEGTVGVTGAFGRNGSNHSSAARFTMPMAWWMPLSGTSMPS
ncbi:hypothetical protein [Streptomyces sp. NPDC046939]